MSLAVQSPARQNTAETVLRFTRTERAVHWVHAVTFLTLLITGFVLSTAALEGIVGHRALLREIHLASAFFFVFGPALVAFAGNRRAVRQDVRDFDRWSPDDIRWLRHPQVDPSPDSPPQGKFNAGQKLNAIFTLYATFAFSISGLILWQNRRFPFTVVTQANTIHTALAYIALAVFFGHIYLAVLHPATRHALQGMIYGRVRLGWARHHRAAWTTFIEDSPLTPRSVARSVVLLVLGLEVAALVTRVGFIALGANATDAVTSAIYRWSALPGTLAATPTGIHLLDLAAVLWAGFLLIALRWIVARVRAA